MTDVTVSAPAVADPSGDRRARGVGRRALRVSAITVTGLLMLFALALLALRIVLVGVPARAASIQAWVEQETHLRLRFSRLDARLRWYGPEIVLHDLRVLDRADEQALVAMREGSVAIDLWNFLRTGELVAGRIDFAAPVLTIVRLADGRIRLLGLGERPVDRPPFDFDRLPAGRLVVSDATIHVRDLKDRRGPWTVRRLELVLRRDRDQIVAAGMAELPERLGRHLRFEGRLDGSLRELDRLNVRLEFRADDVRLAGVRDLVPRHLAQPVTGGGRLEGAVAMTDGRLTRLSLDTALKDVVLRLPERRLAGTEVLELSHPYRPPGSPPLTLPQIDKRVVTRPAPALPPTVAYPALNGRVDVAHDDGAWSFTVANLRLARRTDAPIVPARLQGRWRGRLATTWELALDADRLRLDDLWPLAQAFAPAAAERWLALAPRGDIERLRLGLVRRRAGAALEFTVDAALDDFGVAPVGRWPGVTGLTATLAGSDTAGRAMIASPALDFTWPRAFREPVGRTDLRAQVDWHRDAAGWRIQGQHVAVEHPLARAEGGFELDFAGLKQSPVLRLTATVPHANAVLVRRLLPLARLKPRSGAWLDRAFVAGQAVGGVVRYDGPVRRFPFRDGGGQFLATFDVRDATLDYFDGFAPLTGASGRVELRNAGLHARLDAGRVGALRVGRGTVTIPDLKAAVIDIDAAATGDVGGALGYLQSSPLGPVIGRTFMQLTGRGAAGFDVRLHLPTREPTGRAYEVRAALDAANLELPALRAPLEAVSGRLTIDQHGLRSDGMRGRYVGGPFSATVAGDPASPAGQPSAIVRARGRAAGAELPGLVGLPVAIAMSGAADWSLTLRARRAQPGQPWPLTLSVASDLRGLAIDAPQPFAKAVTDPRATEIALRTELDGVTDVEVRSGAAHARLRFADLGGRQQFDRGVVRFDDSTLTLPAHPGLTIAGDWPDFDLAQWIALGGRGTAGRNLPDWLGPVDVRLTRARLYGYELHDLAAALRPLSDRWQVDVEGPDAAGRITVPFDTRGGAPIVLELARLRLEPAARAASTGNDAGIAADPRRVPALDVTASDFVWRGRRFGRLEATLRREPAGLSLRRLESTAPTFGISATGRWEVVGEGLGAATRTSIDATLTSSDFAATSTALGYRDSIEAQHALAQATLAWPGGPSADVIGRMSGRIHVELDKGQLRNVKPGAGRVLGLMSVVELPRRLALDFRDVTDEGLAFDSVHGDFDVRDGDAYTENLLLKGAAVDIGVAGRTGLESQDYDQTVIVSGNPGGPLTVAGALAAGPVVGAGVLVLSQLFKGQLQGLTRAYYHVTGPWSDPVVERIPAPSDASLAAKEDAPDGSTSGTLGP